MNCTLALVVLTLLARPVLAQDADAPAPAAAAASASAPVSAPAPAWEGAIGVNLGYRPEYEGASRQRFKPTPVLFLRYGRFTITNASGFVTRRTDDVVRGLGMDMMRSDHLRVNLALRFDAGRSESTSAALAGMGDIKPTVRARLTAGWRFSGPWRLGASWSVDAFGRGGGNFGDVNLGHETTLTPATRLTLGSSISLAGDRYMQTYYGVSEAQATRTSYAVYTPSSGLRDVSAFASLRHDIGHEWTWLTSGNVTRLLGPAADSPLSVHRNNWSLSSGLAWRF